jgi:hypothetical protein
LSIKVIQNWCNKEHQGYTVDILSGLHVSSQIACSDGHSEAVQKGENFKPTRLTCVTHVSHAGLKRVTHRLRNSKGVCNTCGSDGWGRTSVVNGRCDNDEE